MKKSKSTDEQIAITLKQAEGGTTVAEVIRRVRVTPGNVISMKAIICRPYAFRGQKDETA